MLETMDRLFHFAEKSQTTQVVLTLSCQCITAAEESY